MTIFNTQFPMYIWYWTWVGERLEDLSAMELYIFTLLIKEAATDYYPHGEDEDALEAFGVLVKQLEPEHHDLLSKPAGEPRHVKAKI